MTRFDRRWLLPLVLALTLGACAQTNGPGAGRGGREALGPGWPGDGGTAGGMGGQSVVEQTQNRLRATAEELKLSPRQILLWENYEEKVGALLSDLLRLQPYRAAQGGALQQIGGKVNTVRDRLTAMEDIAEAAAKLYESLDEAQKKIADRTLAQTVPNLYAGLGGAEGGQGSVSQGMGGGPGGGMGGPMGGGKGGPGGGGGMGRF